MTLATRLLAIAVPILGLVGCGPPEGPVRASLPESSGLLDDPPPIEELRPPQEGVDYSVEERFRKTRTYELGVEGFLDAMLFDETAAHLLLRERLEERYSMRHRLHVLDLASGNVARSLNFEGWISALARAGENRFVVAEQDGMITLRSLPTGEVLRGFEGSVQGVHCLAVHPPMGWLAASYDYEELVVVFDLETGERKTRLTGSWECQQMQFTKSSGHLQARYALGRNLFWSPPAAEPVRIFGDDHFSEFTYQAFAPSGRITATSSEGREVKIWDTATGKEVLELQVHAAEEIGPFDTSLTFLDGGRLLATGTYRGSMKLWYLATGDLLGEVPCATRDGMPVLAPSVDSQWLACAVGGIEEEDGRIEIGMATVDPDLARLRALFWTD